MDQNVVGFCFGGSDEGELAAEVRTGSWILGILCAATRWLHNTQNAALRGKSDELLCFQIQIMIPINQLADRPADGCCGVETESSS